MCVYVCPMQIRVYFMPVHVSPYPPFNLQVTMDALIVHLYSYSADMARRVEGVYHERVKALETQAEALAVTPAQLRAGAEVAARALALPQHRKQ